MEAKQQGVSLLARDSLGSRSFGWSALTKELQTRLQAATLHLPPVAVSAGENYFQKTFVLLLR